MRLVGFHLTLEVPKFQADGKKLAANSPASADAKEQAEVDRMVKVFETMKPKGMISQRTDFGRVDIASVFLIDDVRYLVEVIRKPEGNRGLCTGEKRLDVHFTDRRDQQEGIFWGCEKNGATGFGLLGPMNRRARQLTSVNSDIAEAEVAKHLANIRKAYSE